MSKVNEAKNSSGVDAESPRPAPEYHVIAGTYLAEFIENVNGMIALGFAPFGGIAVLPDEDETWFYQAMLKH